MRVPVFKSFPSKQVQELIRLAHALHSRSAAVCAILRERDTQGRYTAWPEAVVYAESFSWCLNTAAPGLLHHSPELARRIIAAAAPDLRTVPAEPLAATPAEAFSGERSGE